MRGDRADHYARHRWGYRAGRLCGTTVGATVRITVRGDRVRHHASKRLLSPMSRRLSHAAHKGVSARQGIRETFPSAACIHLSLITIPREKPVTTTHAPPASLCPRETFPSSPHAHLPRTPPPRDIPVTAPHTPLAIPHLSERNQSPPHTHLPPASVSARHSRHCSAHTSCDPPPQREKPVTTTHAPPASLCPRETFPSLLRTRLSRGVLQRDEHGTNQHEPLADTTKKAPAPCESHGNRGLMEPDATSYLAVKAVPSSRQPCITSTPRSFAEVVSR